MNAHIYWLYELVNNSGVYQGCKGPGAEGIVRRVAENTDGEPFPVFCVDTAGFVPRGLDPNFHNWPRSEDDWIESNRALVLDFLNAVAELKEGK